MTVDRQLNWDGCFNVRELGGFRAADGRETRWGAVVRSDSPERLTVAGWSALQAHGIRTIVDLRDHVERQIEPEPPAAEFAMVHVPVLDLTDAEFSEEWRGVYDTPRFYRAVLSRWPERFAAAVAAVGGARAAESSSTVKSVATALGSSRRCCFRSPASRPTTSPPTTN